MTDLTSSQFRTTGPAGSGDGSWLALFGLGVVIGTGALLVWTGLQTPGSLTEHLRTARVTIGPLPSPKVSSALLPTDLSLPPVAAELAPPVSETAVEGAHSLEIKFQNAVSVAALEARYADLKYSLDEIRLQLDKVPRVAANTVPGDLKSIVEVDRRKAVFFRMMLPLVLMSNELLLADRVRIQSLHDREGSGEDLSPTDTGWLASQYETYNVKPGDWAELLRRVDMIPPSLALAQAAIESGWGTSRFAREGNALYGQWVWGSGSNGIVPDQRQHGLTHKIRAFKSPLDAVQSYMRNLNSHFAYKEFRDIRAILRRQGAGLNGMTLADGLEPYSEKGRDYIRLVRQIISTNDLRPLDRARLRNEKA